MKYYDASAKNNVNIDTFMEDLMQQVYTNKFGGGEVVERPTIKINRRDQQEESESAPGKGKKKGGCCKWLRVPDATWIYFQSK